NINQIIRIYCTNLFQEENDNLKSVHYHMMNLPLGPSICVLCTDFPASAGFLTPPGFRSSINNITHILSPYVRTTSFDQTPALPPYRRNKIGRASCRERES